MTRRTDSISRRHVLRGAGGATVAIPFLASLQSRLATAQGSASPCLFWMGTGHGGAYESSMFPSQAVLTQSVNAFADHSVRFGDLKAKTEGANTVVSSILQAKSTSLTPGMVGKMNVLYGLDVPFYIAHNTGLHLGNYARNDGNGSDGVAVQKDPRPSIDQILAWSPSFYKSLNGVRERVMVMGAGGQMSWNYANPAARSGGIQAISMTQSSRDMFNRLFPAGAVSAEPSAPKRQAIIDKVIDNYRSLTQSNRRLSKLDKERLDAHVTRLTELQRKLKTTSTVLCQANAKPTDDSAAHAGAGASEYARFSALFNDVVTAAFACGASRLAVLSSGFNEQARAVSYGGSWHQDVAHQWAQPDRQELLRRAYQIVFEGIFLDLANKLDAVKDSQGQPLLDHSLLAWSQECGMSTHDAFSVPVVTFGSAGGWFKTGKLFDFRRVNPSSAWIHEANDPATGKKFVMYAGLTYNQWLATVLQAMGSPPSEWERWGHKGYGVPFVSQGGTLGRHYINTSSRYFMTASDPLPGMRA